MTNLVEFPGLGISLEVQSEAFSIFGLSIAWYGVIITGGIILAVLFAFTQCKSFGVDGDRMLDVILVGVVCGVLGARLYYIAFFDDMSFGNFFNFRSGGLAIYGGIIGAFISVPLTCRWRKVPMLPMFDLTAMGFLIGQGVGRWGNFFNQEAFGSNTTLPWGMISPTTTAYLASHQQTLAEQGFVVDPFAPVHPTFLYESIWCLLGFLLLFLYRKHRRFNGELLLMYVMWYGLGRFWIEGLRTDSLMLNSLGVPVSQLLAATSVLVGLALWIFARVKYKGKPLVVPALPERTAKVKLANGQTVTVSWPGADKDPTREERQKLAEEKWEQQQTEKVEKKKAAEKKAADAAQGEADEPAKDIEAENAEPEETKEEPQVTEPEEG